MTVSERPRTLFLNELHELTRAEKSGGGRPPKLAPGINWTRKGQALRRALEQTRETIEEAHDPGCEKRFYFLVEAEEHIAKLKSKKGQQETTLEKVDFGGQHSRGLRRLGMDILDVSEHGVAVHTPIEEYERLHDFTTRLATAGSLDQSRWAPLRSFAPIPSDLRIDAELLQDLAEVSVKTLVVTLHPLMTRAENDAVFQEVLDVLRQRMLKGPPVAHGADFSGRPWIRCNFSHEAAIAVAERFFSIQSIYEPITSRIEIVSDSGAAKKSGETPKKKPKKKTKKSPSSTKPSLPEVTVGLVDGGVRQLHEVLSPYRRSTYIPPDGPDRIFGAHGCYVASRIVFGDVVSGEDVPAARCLFLDIHVQADAWTIDDALVVPAIQAASSAYPDVRVYNLSFAGSVPLHSREEVRRRECMFLMQDLDNLIFSKDLVVVVAAGNSMPGTIPRFDYPEHYRDEDWAFGYWAGGYNTVTVGSFVRRPSALGMTQEVGAPSPFCRVGPGLGDAPMPDLSSDGGDVDATYQRAPGSGVMVCNEDCQWEDHIGTSFAAPLVAREFAMLLHSLRDFCAPDTRPYAVTARAFFMLSSSLPNPDLPDEYRELCRRTLGRGEPRHTLLTVPPEHQAVFLWQGVLESTSDLVRLQVPIPKSWLKRASAPRLELYVCWDSPVNSRMITRYACRRIVLRVRPDAGFRAFSSLRRDSTSPDYPAMRRVYDLEKAVAKFRQETKKDPNDVWLIELSYDDSESYPPQQIFTPELRVGLAFRLFDAEPDGEAPYAHVIALPLAQSATRLSARARVPTNSGIRARVSGGG